MKDPLTIDDIINHVSKRTLFTRIEITGKTRHSKLPFARQIVCYLAYRYTFASVMEIATAMNTTRTMVGHNYNIIANLQNDEEKSMVLDIENTLRHIKRRQRAFP